MRGRTPAIKQARFGQDERAGAGRGHAPASFQALSHKFDQSRCRGFNRGAAADSDQRVEAAIVERLRDNAHADRVKVAAAGLGDQLHFINRFADFKIRELKDGDDRETHDLEARKDDETDALHGPLHQCLKLCPKTSFI